MFESSEYFIYYLSELTFLSLNMNLNTDLRNTAEIS